MNPELIAPCGMNCAMCSAHLAMKHDVKARGVKMPYCEGCRPRDKKCAFLKKKCDLLMEGKVKFCYECDTFPCKNLEHTRLHWRRPDQHLLLPPPEPEALPHRRHSLSGPKFKSFYGKI